MEQTAALAIINRTAATMDGGAIYNAFALAIGSVEPLPGILDGGKDASHVHKLTVGEMEKAGLSAANIRRQFQRARWLAENKSDQCRAAYAGSIGDGKPDLGRAYLSLAKVLKSEGIANQYGLDVAAGIVKAKEEKPVLSPLEKAKEKVAKLEKEAEEAAEKERANSPASLAEQICLMIGRAENVAAERKSIFEALAAAASREEAREAAKAKALDERREAAMAA
jgi:hypothetical protein